MAKMGKRRIWPKTLQLSLYIWPFVLGHGHYGIYDICFLSFLSSQKIKEEPPYPLPYGRREKGKGEVANDQVENIEG